jgi:hypothetical protein
MSKDFRRRLLRRVSDSGEHNQTTAAPAQPAPTFGAWDGALPYNSRLALGQGPEQFVSMRDHDVARAGTVWQGQYP